MSQDKFCREFTHFQEQNFLASNCGCVKYNKNQVCLDKQVLESYLYIRICLALLDTWLRRQSQMIISTEYNFQKLFCPRCSKSNYWLRNFQISFSFVGVPLDVDVCLAALLGDNQMIHCPSTLRGYSTTTLLKHFFLLLHIILYFCNPQPLLFCNSTLTFSYICILLYNSFLQCNSLPPTPVHYNFLTA